MQITKLSLSLLLAALLASQPALPSGHDAVAPEVVPQEAAAESSPDEVQAREEAPEEVPGEVNEAQPVVIVPPAGPDPESLPWDVRIDRMVNGQAAFDPEAENPDELFQELDNLLRIRARQFELIMADASSRSEPADDHVEVLAAIFPGADPNLLPLPSYVTTVQEAHENFLGLYNQRIRLLDFVSNQLRLEITSTDLVGMRQLYFEFRMIGLELRYQVLRIPDAGEEILMMAQRAPLPLVWFVLQLLVLLVLFRWWRRWFPETLNRMQSYLRGIKPRTTEVVRRMRGVWYIQQVRSPLEWLIFFYALIEVLDFLGLVFVTAITRIIVTWILLAWFAVEFLDAIVARGAGGLASDIGRTRQKSLRWFAAWLVLLGLGLALAERLAGNAALYALVWRIVQVLFFPLLFLQLGLWRTQLFRRAEREDPEFMTQEAFDAQRGLGKYFGSAKLCGFLVASKLRNTLLRSLEELGTSRVSGSSLISVNEKDTEKQLGPAFHDLLLAGPTDYEKYCRTERRQLIERIGNNHGGSVTIIGERGIGKDGFITKVCENFADAYIDLNCNAGTAADIEAQLAAQLDLPASLEDPAALRAAIKEKGIKLIALRQLHMIVRPVVGGFDELNKVMRIIDALPTGVTRLLAMDRYAWFYTRSAMQERASSLDRIDLPEWTDDQIGEMIQERCTNAGVSIDFSTVRVPSQYLDAGEEEAVERNRKGVYTVAARLSGGNPSIAMQLFLRCLRQDEAGGIYATVPTNRDPREVEQASLHVLLMLKVIAQAEGITRELLRENLRYPRSVIDNSLQLVTDRQWVEVHEGRYSLALPWFRTITRVLSRQNLLAGVRQEVT